jgi:hypothetical protein
MRVDTERDWREGSLINEAIAKWLTLYSNPAEQTAQAQTPTSSIMVLDFSIGPSLSKAESTYCSWGRVEQVGMSSCQVTNPK